MQYLKKKFSSLVTLTTFQVLSGPTVLDGKDLEHFHSHRKFYPPALQYRVNWAVTASVELPGS